MKFRPESYQKATVVAWAVRLASIGFALINTRLLFELIGAHGYSIYAVLLSFSGWMALFNLGLPNAVQNYIAKLRVKGIGLDKLKSNLAFLSLILSVCFIPILYFIAFLSYKSIFDEYKSLISISHIFLVLYIFLLTGLSQIYYKILYAEHKNFYPNFYPLVISLLATFLLVVLYLFRVQNLFITLLAVFAPQALVFFVSFYHSIGVIKFKFDKEIIFVLLKLSNKFFIFAFLASCTLGVDYFIMLKFLSAADIAKYNLLMKFYILVITLHAVLIANSWALTSEAFCKKDTQTIFKIIKKNLLIGFLLNCVVSLVLIPFGHKIFFMLSGNDINISIYLLLLASIYTFIRIWTDTLAGVIASMNDMNIMIFLLPFQAFISVVAQYYFIKAFGINGVFYGLILSFVATVSLFLPIRLFTKLKGLKNE